ncbi:hypothetical protein BBJ28_00012353 [Nothophytophthora sp. Chile5]|nr:hypothetical protein BBJ28_00012353 [Nothophytophthora sp. Chile5]
MTGLQLGKGVLQRVVAERNVRSILFQLTPASAQRAFIQGPDALSQCLDSAGRSFGPYRVLFSQVFYESSLTFALVNLKPIVPVGHVLVVPKRPVARFEMLDADEVGDLGYTSCTQDGEAAGQTVKHVHIHVIPRFRQDFERNDDIYTEVLLSL